MSRLGEMCFQPFLRDLAVMEVGDTSRNSPDQVTSSAKAAETRGFLALPWSRVLRASESKFRNSKAPRWNWNAKALSTDHGSQAERSSCVFAIVSQHDACWILVDGPKV